MDVSQQFVPTGSVLKPVLFSTFPSDVVVGVRSGISKAGAGAELPLRAKHHANGKELQKDLRKLNVRVKRQQRSTSAEKYEWIHLEIK